MHEPVTIVGHHPGLSALLTDALGLVNLDTDTDDVLPDIMEQMECLLLTITEQHDHLLPEFIAAVAHVRTNLEGYDLQQWLFDYDVLSFNVDGDYYHISIGSPTCH